MKVRTSFVSNSSSSSFVVVGRTVGNVFAGDVNLEQGKKYVMIGRQLRDGVDLVMLNNRLLKWFRENAGACEGEFDGDVIETEYMESEAFGDPLPAIPEGNRIWVVEADQNCTHDVESAKARYLER